VIPSVSKLYQVTRRANVRLSIMISLDGVSDIHDAVRGRKGNFDAVQECMQYFLDNNIGDAHSFGCTLIRDNVEHAEKLMLYSMRRGIYCRFRVGIPHQRLYNDTSLEPFGLTRQERFHLLNFIDTLISSYEQDQARKIFLLNLRNQIAYNEPRKNGCAWQGEGVTLESNGTLSYCAVQSPPLGNLIETPDKADVIYFQSTHVRDNILQTKCDGCLHDYGGRNFRNSHHQTAYLTGLVRLISTLKNAILPPIKAYLRKGKDRLKRNLLKPLHLRYFLIADIFAEQLLRFRSDLSLHQGAAEAQRSVLIVGWYGTETLGDKAILYSILDDLMNNTSVYYDIVVASIEPYITEYTLFEGGYSDRVSVVSIDLALRSAKIGIYSEVIFGGGPLMPSIAYMRQLARIFFQVKRLGGLCKIWGCGIGPIRKLSIDIPSKIALSTILRMSSLVVFRDNDSIALAKKYSPRNDYRAVALDPAYFWFRKVALYQLSQATINTSSPSSRYKKSILIALRSLPVGEYFSDLSPQESSQLQHRFNSSASRLILSSPDEYSYVYLQPMHRLACGGDDRLFYSTILEEGGRLDLVNWKHESPVDDVMRFLQADVCVVMRYHSLVLALAARRPVLPIDYTSGGKVGSLCKALGIRCLSVNEFCALDIRDIPHLVTPVSAYIASLEECEYTSRLAYDALVAKKA
jgi:polysaccharide pyruvyl transferase WcaK-like protein